ncbi:uncharacterized protein LOC110977527 [Acanthaster planci]|uniref:Uncharacterized protein LOC110977527 n=1 Tax=Acanthaster planci TaxID=133434 RepID=A0A8B7Y6N3_ACAPL|nr:uncharacterized protein LOC110977527 [Acanthaster planci]
MAGSAKLYYIWNFFEKIAPTGFVAGWLRAANYVQTNKEFISTQLHRNLNPEGAFKYVNHAAFDGLTFEGFQRSKPTEAWASLMKSEMASKAVAYPGGYTEIATNTGKPLAPWLPKGDNGIFIVTSFKVADETDTKLQETFEKDWMESSGTNFILQQAPKELGISHVGLYKKFTPRPGLLYVLRVELVGVGEDSEAARSFLSQLKAFSFPNYFERVVTDLYRADPENILFPEAGRKDLPEGFSYKP